jgi:hypothetical protein
MMIVYLDETFKCHTSCGENMREAETPYFDNKCKTFIEGYRFIPSDVSWTDEYGTVFIGEMIMPWKPYSELDITQRAYEQEQYDILLAEKHSYTEAYNLGVNEA